MEDFVEKMKAANQNFLEEIISLWEASKRQLEEHTDIKVEELKAGLEEVQRRNLKVEEELMNLGEEKGLMEVAKEEAVKEVEARPDQAKITELEEVVKKLEGFKETAGELIYGAGSRILVRILTQYSSGL